MHLSPVRASMYTLADTRPRPASCHQSPPLQVSTTRRQDMCTGQPAAGQAQRRGALGVEEVERRALGHEQDGLELQLALHRKVLHRQRVLPGRKRMGQVNSVVRVISWSVHGSPADRLQVSLQAAMSNDHDHQGAGATISSQRSQLTVPFHRIHEQALHKQAQAPGDRMMIGAQSRAPHSTPRSTDAHLPVVGQRLVERVVLLLADLLRRAHPDRLLLVDQLPLVRYLLHLLLLLLLLLLVLLDLPTVRAARSGTAAPRVRVRLGRRLQDGTPAPRMPARARRPCIATAPARGSRRARAPSLPPDAAAETAARPGTQIPCFCSAHGQPCAVQRRPVSAHKHRPRTHLAGHRPRPSPNHNNPTLRPRTPPQSCPPRRRPWARRRPRRRRRPPPSPPSSPPTG